MVVDINVLMYSVESLFHMFVLTKGVGSFECLPCIIIP